MKKSKGDKALVLICYLILILVAVVIVLPILNLVAVSVSDQAPVISGKVKFWPVGFQLEAYRYVIGSRQFFTSLSVSLFVTLVGSTLAVICSVLVAYPLSRQNIPGRKALLLIFLFTMMFNGGIIPSYLLIMRLNMINSVWSLILPQLVNVYNLLIVKNYMEALPESLVEAAKIDGANNLQIFIRVILPVIRNTLLTIMLIKFIDFWNDYQAPLLLWQSSPTVAYGLYWMSTTSENGMNFAPKRMTASMIVFFPIIIIFLLLQKRLLGNLTVGGIKG